MVVAPRTDDDDKQRAISKISSLESVTLRARLDDMSNDYHSGWRAVGL